MGRFLFLGMVRKMSVYEWDGLALTFGDCKLRMGELELSEDGGGAGEVVFPIMGICSF